MTEDQEQPGTRLDAYLDDVMTPDERAAYQRKIESDEPLRDQIEVQQDIDQSLRRLFAPPSADRVTAGIAEVPVQVTQAAGAGDAGLGRCPASSGGGGSACRGCLRRLADVERASTIERLESLRPLA